MKLKRLHLLPISLRLFFSSLQHCPSQFLFLGPETPTNLAKGGRSLALTARPKGLPYAMWVSHHPFPGIEDLGTWRHIKECNTNHGSMWRSRNSTAYREIDISFHTTKSYLLIYSCIHVTHIIIYILYKLHNLRQNYINLCLLSLAGYPVCGTTSRYSSEFWNLLISQNQIRPKNS